MRVARLKVRRELERGELDAALRDLARLLRLSRDLLPSRRDDRRHGLCSADRARDRTRRHADADREGPDDRALRSNARAFGRTRYSIDRRVLGGPARRICSNRSTLHDLIFEQDRLRREWEAFGNQAGPSIVAEIAEPVALSALAGNARLPKPAPGARSSALSQRLMSLRNIPDLDALIARTTPDELATQVAKLNDLYRGLLSVSDATVLERIRKSTDRPHSLDEVDLHTRVTRGVSSSAFTALRRAWHREGQDSRCAGAGRGAAMAAQSRRSLPPSMEAAAKEAGLRRYRSIRSTGDRSDSRSSMDNRRSTPLGRTAGTTAVGSTMPARPTRATCCCGCRGREARCDCLFDRSKSSTLTLKTAPKHDSGRIPAILQSFLQNFFTSETPPSRLFTKSDEMPSATFRQEEPDVRLFQTSP